MTTSEGLCSKTGCSVFYFLCFPRYKRKTASYYIPSFGSWRKQIRNESGDCDRVVEEKWDPEQTTEILMKDCSSSSAE